MASLGIGAGKIPSYITDEDKIARIDYTPEIHSKQAVYYVYV